MARVTYDGVLRCRVKILSLNEVKIDWVDEETNETIWSETAKAPVEGFAIVSQIRCSGTFDTTSGYFVDEFGLKHHNMKAEPGDLASLFSK